MGSLYILIQIAITLKVFFPKDKGHHINSPIFRVDIHGDAYLLFVKSYLDFFSL